MSEEPIYSFAALRNRLVVRGWLEALTALRIGAGRASDVVANDLPVLRDSLNAPFVPGASLKGTLRARLEALIRAAAPHEARDLLETEDVMRTRVPAIREHDYIERLRSGASAAEADRIYSDAIWHHSLSTLIDLTFGAPWVAGRVFVRDATVDRQLWFGQFEVRNGVALNRDTETAQEGLLYDYEVVPAGTRFDFELVAENMADWQLGMLLLGLQPFETGTAQIGGFRTRGLGYVQLVDVEYHYREIAAGAVDDLLRFVCDDATLQALDIAPGNDRVSDEQRITWLRAFRSELISRAQEGRDA